MSIKSLIMKSYYLYKKQEKYSGQDWVDCLPQVLSPDGDGTMPLVIKSNDDEACYVPPVYRWVDTTDTVCVEVEENPYATEYMSFDIVSGGTIMWLRCSTDAPQRVIYYSRDDGTTWSSLTPTLDGTVINVSEGEKLMFKGENDYYGMGIVSPGAGGENQVSFSGSTASFNVYGNIMSMIYGDNFVGQTDMVSGNYTRLIGGMFESTNVIDASNLVLPAMTLKNECYFGMFYDCRKLIYPPQLPAMTLYYSCYNYMFHGCSSLLEAPELPATTLVNNCYDGMFYGCTSLVNAPLLPAETLAPYCYRIMFDGCTNISYIKCLATDISATECTTAWVRNVSPNGTFVKNYSNTDWQSGNGGIPNNWRIEND